MSIKIQKRGGVVHNAHRDSDGDLVSNCGSGERYAMGSLRQMSKWIELPESAETTCKKCKKQADEAERLGLHLTVVKNENGSSRVVDTRNETEDVAEPSVYEDPAVRAAIRETVTEQADDEAPEPLDAVLNERAGSPVTVTVDRYTEGRASVKMRGHAFGDMTREAYRIGRKWELVDQEHGRIFHTVRAGSLQKVVKAWAKKLNTHAGRIDVTRSF